MKCQIERLKKDIEKLTSLTLLETQTKVNFYLRAILNLLKSFPVAWGIKFTSKDEIKKAIKIEGRERKLDISEEEIIALAKTYIASFCPGKELILSQKTSLLFFLMDRLEEIIEMLKKFCKESIYDDAEILKSLKDMGSVAALHFFLPR